MNDPVTHDQPPPSPLAAHEAEPIHAALEIEDGLVFWSGSGWVNPLSVLALSGTLSQPIILVLVRAGVPMAIAASVVIAVVLVVILFAVTRWRRRRAVASWARNPDGYKSDPSFRLRLIGPGEQNLYILKQLETDESFEPVIRRSWSDHQFRLPASPASPGKDNPASDLSSALGVGLTVGVIAVTLGLLTLLKVYGLTFGTNRLPQVHEALGAAGLAALLRGWLSPAYIRLVPGRLDVLQWRFFNIGRPICRTYDLRRAKIAVILRARTVRIEDPSNKERPVVCFRWLTDQTDGRDWPTTILRAARTRYPTPALPDDALLG